MNDFLYRLIVVVAWTVIGIQYNIDTLHEPLTWMALTISAIGAYVIAVNLPPFIENKRAEVEAMLEGMGLR